MEEHDEVTDFKASISFDERLSQSSYVLGLNPGNIPIVIVKAANCNYPIKTLKLSLPSAYSISHVLSQLRRKLYLRKQDSLFLYFGRRCLMPGQRIGQLYGKYADEDGVLYLVVASQEDKGSFI